MSSNRKRLAIFSTHAIQYLSPFYRELATRINVVATNSIRTLFVCGGTTTFGCERVNLRYIGGLYRRGRAVECTASGWNDGTFPRELDAIGVPYQAIKLGWLYLTQPKWTADSLVHLPGALSAYAQTFRRFRPDFVIHNGYRSLAFLAWMVGRKNIVAVHDYWTKSWERKLVRLMDRKVLAYISVSNDISRHLESLGLPRSKIVRIYNPIPFPNEPRVNVPRNGPYRFGITGQVIERKGHHVVIEALSIIRQQRPAANVRLKVFGVGDPNYIERMKILATERGVSDWIEWCGYRSHLDEIYTEFDCSLVPTVTPDPAPLAAIEPGAYSLPAITSTTGGLAELVLDGMTGYLVPPNDATALADRMLRMIDDPESGRAMGRIAFDSNKERFDEPIAIDQLELLFLTLKKLN